MKILLLVAALVVNVAVFVFMFRVATARPLSVREVAPGAVGAAVLWQLLQTFGVVYVGHVINGASATNGVFALVLGLLAFLYATANAIVICAEVNAVRIDKLYPRSLLTPFTDNVELTRGDRRSYTDLAKAQRAKGFQEVDVSFHPHGDQEVEADAPKPPTGNPAITIARAHRQTTWHCQVMLVVAHHFDVNDQLMTRSGDMVPSNAPRCLRQIPRVQGALPMTRTRLAARNERQLLTAASDGGLVHSCGAMARIVHTAANRAGDTVRPSGCVESRSQQRDPFGPPGWRGSVEAV